MTGRVKFFLEDKGYGFILTEVGDVFVHFQDVKRESLPLRAGELVEFSITQGPKGPIARDVRPVSVTEDLKFQT